MFELGHVRAVLGERFCDERPKRRSVVELGQVTQLVYHDVILEVWWEEEKLVIEIEILQR